MTNRLGLYFCVFTICNLLCNAAMLNSKSSSIPIEDGNKIDKQFSNQLATFSNFQNSLCVDDENGPKFVNDTCNDDKECFGESLTMFCKNQQCTCKSGLAPEEIELPGNIKKVICVQAPYLFQPCTSVCQKPLICHESSFSTSGFQTAPFKSITGKNCQCVPPYKFQDGVCFLECKDDEYFIEDRCVKKCTSKEVRLNNLRCAPLAQLESHCESDYQCEINFSSCQNGTCKCLAGFKRVNKTCVSNAPSCPVGRPLTKGSALIVCKTNRIISPYFVVVSSSSSSSRDQPTNGQRQVGKIDNFAINHSCPASHFCLSGETESSGHCCPRLNVSCPVGQIHESATCVPDTEGSTNVCPFDSHYCHVIAIGGSYGEQLCCPRACSEGFVPVEGKCYPNILLGEECSVNEQCVNHKGLCKSGKCVCTENAKIGGSQFYRFCQIQCADEEVEFENRCISRFNLGDACNTSTSWRCPLNSVCKNAQCSCACGTYPINGTLCGPLPVCSVNPTIGQSGIFNAKNWSSSAVDIFANSTFCKIDQQLQRKSDSFEPIAQNCPIGQYCSSYLTSLGLCCPKPAPVCPNGQKPDLTLSCNINSQFECGPTKFCYRYLNPAILNSPEGFVCCQIERPVFFPVELPPPQLPVDPSKSSDFDSS